jgi:hypothetical protein
MSEPDLPIQESELLMILFDYYLFRLVSQQKLQKNRKNILLKINLTPNFSLASHFYLVYSL